MRFVFRPRVWFLPIFLLASFPAIGQQTAAPTASGGRFRLADGTPVRLRLKRTISSASSQTNDTVDFDVLEDVKVNGVVVVSKGALAIATVTNAEPKRRMGKGGKLDVNIDYVRLADDDKAALRAVKGVQGGGHTGAMTAGIVATSLVAWPAAPFFLFMHGKDVTIPEGTEITAYVNGDMDLDPAKFGAGPVPAAPAQAASPQSPAAPSNPPAASTPRSLSDVSIGSTPDGADITVDGNYVGSTPSTIELAPGDHTVLVQKSGFQPWERTIHVTPNGVVNIKAALEKVQ